MLICVPPQVEMHRRGQLQSLHGLMATYDRSWIRWSIALLAKSAAVARKVVGGVIHMEDGSQESLDHQMVIMDLLKVHYHTAQATVVPLSVLL